MRQLLVLLALCVFFASSAIVAGKIEAERSDGTRVILDRKQSTKTIIYADGKKETIELKGKTPFGIAIDEIKRGIQQEPVQVTLVYDPLVSDEMCEGEVKTLFEELYGSLRSKVGGKRYEGVKPLIVQVSFCRYGEYGYCQGKRSTVSATVRENGTVLSTTTIKANELKDKKQRLEFVSKVVSTLK